MKKEGGSGTIANKRVAKKVVKSKVAKEVGLTSKKMSAIAARVKESKSSTKTDSLSSVDSSARRLESIAMVNHVHTNGANVKKFFTKSIRFKDVTDVLNNNWTLWRLTYSILWRAFVIMFAIQFLFAIAKILVSVFIFQTATTL